MLCCYAIRVATKCILMITVIRTDNIVIVINIFIVTWAAQAKRK